MGVMGWSSIHGDRHIHIFGCKTYHRLTMAHMLIYYGDIGICVDFSNKMGT